MRSRGTRLLLRRSICSAHARGSFGTRRITPAPSSRRPSLARRNQFRRALASSPCAQRIPAVSSNHRISRAPSRYSDAVVSSNVQPGTGMPRSGRHSDTSFRPPKTPLPCHAPATAPCLYAATARPAPWKERLDPLVSPCMRPHAPACRATLALPFICRVAPFRLTPITRIRGLPPPAAEPPLPPAPSMARIARSLPKRATAGCLSRTAGNLSQIPGRSQRERHSCRKAPQPGVSCHQPTPQALRRIERRAQSAALARIAGWSLGTAGRPGRAWIPQPE